MPKAPQIRSRTEQRNKRTAVRKKATSGRCLDAAHGEAERARGAVQRIAIEGRKEDARTIVGTRHKSGRCPIIAMRPDEVQASRFPVAVARSRRKKQSLEGMRRRGKQFTTLRLSESKDRSRALPSKSKVKPRRGLIQNSELMDSLREFDSTIVILRSIATKNLLISSIHSSCARPGRLRGSRFQREPAPGARSSVSEREQSLRDMLAIIVIEESILGKVTDVSLRST